MLLQRVGNAGYRAIATAGIGPTLEPCTALWVPQSRVRREWQLRVRNVLPPADIVVTQCGKPIAVAVSPKRFVALDRAREVNQRAQRGHPLLLAPEECPRLSAALGRRLRLHTKLSLAIDRIRPPRFI